MDDIFCTNYNIKFNKKKTAVIMYSRDEQEKRLDINLGTGNVEVKEFCYLGRK